MPLYQYHNKAGRLLLQNLQWRVTPPNKFNDPFEMSPIMRLKDPHAFARWFVDTAFVDSAFFNDHKVVFPLCRDFAEFQRLARANRSTLFENMLKDISKLELEAQQINLDTISEDMGVICLTYDPLQPLMWAHYADKHRGLVIEFDETNPTFSPPDFLTVDYRTDRAEHDPFSRDAAKNIDAFARRKSLHWAYEQECRLLVALRDTVEAKDDQGDAIRVLPIVEPSIIKSVTYGLRIDTVLRHEVEVLLKADHFNHVERFEVHLDNAEFQLRRRRAV